MAGKSTPVLLVTANVGSIFEDPSVMLKIWTEEFLSTVARLDPKFVALHCQEVGGKNYERSMKHVEYFVRLLMSSEELRLFDKVRVYLDEDYSSAENFTALGNFYFIHESISDVLIWDFAAISFVPAKGKDVHSGNIEAVSTKEKSKFPQDFFPECKWSRKGFLRTRWSLNGTVFDLINIHLFHDASNFIAMEMFPSVYCKNRQRALEHTLDRFHNDDYGPAPFFVFGDFNFRTDTEGVVKKLADGLNPVRIQSNKNTDHTKLQYRDGSSEVILSLGKKEFSHVNHQNMFIGNDGKWLKEFDRELEAFNDRLFEFLIAFPPSYPFEEDEKGAKRYMQTRCPSWCDRVILSSTAKSLVNNISDASSVEYGLMGSDTCMGDHKPVYLRIELLTDAGTVSCCTYRNADNESPPCFGRYYLPGNNARVPPCWSCSKSLKAPVANVFVTESPPLTLSVNFNADGGNHFLAPPHASLLHEPYTPDSMETPSSSPIPVRLQRDFGAAVELSEWKHEMENTEAQDSEMSKMSNEVIEGRLKEQESTVVNTITSDIEEVDCINVKFSPFTLCANELGSAATVSSHKSLPNFPKYVSENKSDKSPKESYIPKKDKRNPFHFSLESGSTVENLAKAELAVSVPLYLKQPVKRVQSASVVEVSAGSCNDPSSVLSETAKALLNTSPQQGMRDCRCFSDSWRRRTVPSVPFHSRSRVRLISTSSAHSSSRLHSHHSSSDEDWFEEIDSESNNVLSDSLLVSVNQKDCNISVPIQNVKDIANEFSDDVFIMQPQGICSKVVPMMTQEKSQNLETDFNDVLIMPFDSVLTENRDSLILVSQSGSNLGNQKSFRSDNRLGELHAFSDTIDESQQLVDTNLLKTEDLHVPPVSSAIPSLELAVTKCVSIAPSVPQECMLNLLSTSHLSSTPKSKSLRSETECSTSLESITLSVTSKVIKTKEKFTISPEKNLTTKKKRSDSKRKMHQCCVII